MQESERLMNKKVFRVQKAFNGRLKAVRHVSIQFHPSITKLQFIPFLMAPLTQLTFNSSQELLKREKPTNSKVN
jgi:hypothetical protein